STAAELSRPLLFGCESGDAARRAQQLLEMRLPLDGAAMLLRGVEQIVEQDEPFLHVRLFLLEHPREDPDRRRLVNGIGRRHVGAVMGDQMRLEYAVDA